MNSVATPNVASFTRATTLKATLALAALLAIAGTSRADVLMTTRFVNTTGITAWDLHTSWALTGGTVDAQVIINDLGNGPVMTVNPPPNGVNNQVNIIWDPLGAGVPNNNGVTFTFHSAAVAQFLSGFWSDKNGESIGPATPSSVVPEPSSVMLLAVGLGALVGIGWCRRKSG